MKCKKCGSENINVQVVTKVKSKNHGLIYWLFIGWWLEITMWLLFTIPWLIIKIFKPKKIANKVQKQAVCQNCGNSWKI